MHVRIGFEIRVWKWRLRLSISRRELPARGRGRHNGPACRDTRAIGGQISSKSGQTIHPRAYFVLGKACAAARTSAAWPSTFTLGHTFATLPSAATKKVERSMPMYFLPYMDFSTHTP